MRESIPQKVIKRRTKVERRLRLNPKHFTEARENFINPPKRTIDTTYKWER